MGHVQALVAPPTTPPRLTLVVERNATHPMVLLFQIPALGGTPSPQQQVTRCEELSPVSSVPNLSFSQKEPLHV